MIGRCATSPAHVLAALVLLHSALPVVRGQSITVPLSQGSSWQAIEVPPQSPAVEATLLLDEEPAGGGRIVIATEDPAIVISLVRPNGSEVTESSAGTAGFGYQREDLRSQDFTVPFLLSGGINTVITLPAGLPPGTYRIRADSRGVTRSTALVYSYRSSGTVRVGVATADQAYSASTPVAISGFAFGQSGALSGVQMEAKVTRTTDVSTLVSIRSLGLPVSRQAISATRDRVAYRPEVINTHTSALPAVLGFCSPTEAAASTSIVAVRCGLGPGDLAAGAVYTATATDTIEFDVPTGQSVTLSQLSWSFESRSAPVSVPLQDAGPIDPVAGNGTYAGEFTPALPGVYSVLLTAQGTTPAGVPFSRQAATSFKVVTGLAKLGAAVVAQLVDSDGNGLAEALRLSFPVTGVPGPGEYSVAADLVAPANNNKTVSIARSANFAAAGNQTITVDVLAREVFELGADGPYQIRKVMLTREDTDPRGSL